MGTRSCIAVDHGGVIKAVYCHYDGYLENNGKILYENYPSERANYLVSLGDLSTLGKDTDPDPLRGDHSFKTPQRGVCVFYGRDRKEKGVEFNTLESLQEMFDVYCHCEYFYLMRDGQWLVSTGYEFQPLKDALIEAEILQVANY